MGELCHRHVLPCGKLPHKAAAGKTVIRRYKAHLRHNFGKALPYESEAALVLYKAPEQKAPVRAGIEQILHLLCELRKVRAHAAENLAGGLVAVRCRVQNMLKAGLAHVLGCGDNTEHSPALLGEAVKQRRFKLLRHAVGRGLTEIAPHTGKAGVLIAYRAQLMFDGGFAIGWQSVLGDYIIAYSVLGLAGLFHKNKYGLLIGTAVGCAARFLVHYVVGATVWGEYMPDTFFGMTMTTPWFYSALYNGSYMLIDMIFCLLLGWLAYTLIGKYIRGEDIEALSK